MVVSDVQFKGRVCKPDKASASPAGYLSIVGQVRRQKMEYLKGFVPQFLCGAPSGTVHRRHSGNWPKVTDDYYSSTAA